MDLKIAPTLLTAMPQLRTLLLLSLLANASLSLRPLGEFPNVDFPHSLEMLIQNARMQTKLSGLTLSAYQKNR